MKTISKLNPFCNLHFVITRFLKERKQSREKVNNFKFILKVTTCSHCGKSLKRCRCPYGDMQIKMLANSLNGL